MSFVLYYPDKATATTTVTLPSPDRGNPLQQIRGQASARSRGGKIYVYDKGVNRYEASYDFADLTDAQKTALEAFFASQADGMINEFQVDDHLGIAYDARFLQSELEWSNTGEQVPGGTAPEWAVSFRIELAAV